jgi:aryl-alcohol dehydrogenase-like predicted oxidoreductase
VVIATKFGFVLSRQENMDRELDSRPEHIREVAENVGAADVELSAEDLGQIQEIVPQGAYGSRYPDAMMPTW